MCHIVPISILCKQAIGRYKGLIAYNIHILTIGAAARPIHKAAGLKGCGIGVFKAYVFSGFTGYWLIFVSCYCSIKRKEHTQTRGGRLVLSGAVNAVPTAQSLYTPEHIVFMPCGYVVKVKGDNITPGHIVGLAAWSV